MAVSAQAQSGTPQRTLTLVPSASLSQTYTSNYLLSDVDPAADAIARATATLALTANGGYLKGFLDYSLSSLIYFRHSDKNSIQNALNARMTAELLPGRGFVDVAANISRSAISAFGNQPGGGVSVQDNVTELRTLRVAPRFAGPLGPDLRYSANLSLAATDAKDTTQGDGTSANVGLHLEPVSKGWVTWMADASALRSDYKAGASTSNERATAGARMKFDDFDTELTGNAGLEYASVLTGTRQRYSNWGVGAAWTPNNRTKLTAQYDDRFFGPSRSIAFDYRTALTSWHFGKSRTLTAPGDSAQSSGRGTAFDLLYAQFASTVPDTAKRTEFVNNYLQAYGISPNASPGFLRSSITIDGVDDISVAYRNARNVAILAVRRTKSERIGVQPGIADDFTNSSAVYLTSISLDLSRQLTPQSSFGLQWGRIQGSGDTSAQDTLQRRLGWRYTLRPSQNSDVALGWTRTLYARFQAAYDESAIVATLSYRF